MRREYISTDAPTIKYYDETDNLVMEATRTLKLNALEKIGVQELGFKLTISNNFEYQPHIQTVHKEITDFFNQQVSLERQQKYIERNAVELKAALKAVTKNRKAVADYKQKMSRDAQEILANMKSSKIFQIQVEDTQIKVSTKLLVGKGDFKTLAKLSNELKVDFRKGFRIENNKTNLITLEEISIRTAKLGQDTLKDRLFPSKKELEVQTFKKWFDEADFPEKVDGIWTDLESGCTFNGQTKAKSKQKMSR